MKPFLRQTIRLEIGEDRQWRFVAVKETSAPGEEVGDSRNRFLHWLVDRYTRIRQGIATTDIRWLKGVDAVLARLESQVEPMETLLMQSRKATAISLRHPPEVASPLVERRFRRLIRRGLRKSSRGMLVSLLMLPLSALMTLFPGPNVFFGWNAYRLISHYLAREGGKRILRGDCPLETSPESVLLEEPQAAVSPTV